MNRFLTELFAHHLNGNTALTLTDQEKAAISVMDFSNDTLAQIQAKLNGINGALNLSLCDAQGEPSPRVLNIERRFQGNAQVLLNFVRSGQVFDRLSNSTIVSLLADRSYNLNHATEATIAEFNQWLDSLANHPLIGLKLDNAIQKLNGNVPPLNLTSGQPVNNFQTTPLTVATAVNNPQVNTLKTIAVLNALGEPWKTILKQYDYDLSGADAASIKSFKVFIDNPVNFPPAPGMQPTNLVDLDAAVRLLAKADPVKKVTDIMANANSFGPPTPDAAAVTPLPQLAQDQARTRIALLAIKDAVVFSAMLNAVLSLNLIPTAAQVTNFKKLIAVEIQTAHALTAARLGDLAHKIWDTIPADSFELDGLYVGAGNKVTATHQANSPLTLLYSIRAPAVRDALLVYAAANPKWMPTADEVALFKTLMANILATTGGPLHVAEFSKLVKTVWVPNVAINPPNNYFDKGGLGYADALAIEKSSQLSAGLYQIRDSSVRDALQMWASNDLNWAPSSESIITFKALVTADILKHNGTVLDALRLEAIVQQVWPFGTQNNPALFYFSMNGGNAVANTIAASQARLVPLYAIVDTVIQDPLQCWAAERNAPPNEWKPTADQARDFKALCAADIAKNGALTKNRFEALVQKIWPKGGNNPPANYFTTGNGAALVEKLLKTQENYAALYLITEPALRDVLLAYANAHPDFKPSKEEVLRFNKRIAALSRTVIDEDLDLEIYKEWPAICAGDNGNLFFRAGGYPVAQELFQRVNDVHEYVHDYQKVENLLVRKRLISMLENGKVGAPDLSDPAHAAKINHDMADQFLDGSTLVTVDQRLHVACDQMPAVNFLGTDLGAPTLIAAAQGVTGFADIKHEEHRLALFRKISNPELRKVLMEDAVVSDELQEWQIERINALSQDEVVMGSAISDRFDNALQRIIPKLPARFLANQPEFDWAKFQNRSKELASFADIPNRYIRQLLEKFPPLSPPEWTVEDTKKLIEELKTIDKAKTLLAVDSFLTSITRKKSNDFIWHRYGGRAAPQILADATGHPTALATELRLDANGPNLLADEEKAIAVINKISSNHALRHVLLFDTPRAAALTSDQAEWINALLKALPDITRDELNGLLHQPPVYAIPVLIPFHLEQLVTTRDGWIKYHVAKQVAALQQGAGVSRLPLQTKRKSPLPNLEIDLFSAINRPVAFPSDETISSEQFAAIKQAQQAQYLFATQEATLAAITAYRVSKKSIGQLEENLDKLMKEKEKVLTDIQNDLAEVEKGLKNSNLELGALAPINVARLQGLTVRTQILESHLAERVVVLDELKKENEELKTALKATMNKAEVVELLQDNGFSANNATLRAGLIEELKAKLEANETKINQLRGAYQSNQATLTGLKAELDKSQTALNLAPASDVAMGQLTTFENKEDHDAYRNARGAAAGTGGVMLCNRSHKVDILKEGQYAVLETGTPGAANHGMVSVSDKGGMTKDFKWPEDKQFWQSHANEVAIFEMSVATRTGHKIELWGGRNKTEKAQVRAVYLALLAAGWPEDRIMNKSAYNPARDEEFTLGDVGLRVIPGLFAFALDVVAAAIQVVTFNKPTGLGLTKSLWFGEQQVLKQNFHNEVARLGKQDQTLGGAVGTEALDKGIKKLKESAAEIPALTKHSNTPRK